MYKSIISLALLLGSLVSQAQVEIGSWRDYLPYSRINTIEDAGDRVYAATPYSILEVVKEDNSITRLSKVEGLTETGITAMAYHEATNTLLIGYQNGNMDFIIDNNRIINVADILRANIISDKGINNFSFYNNEAFISCGFGIVHYDLERMEVRDTYIIGDAGSYQSVNDLTVFKDTIFAATDEGIKKVAYSDPNLTYYARWVVDPNIEHPFGSYSYIESNDDRLFACYPASDSIADTIYEYRSDIGWNVVDTLLGNNINSIRFDDTDILVSIDGYAILYDENWNQIRMETGYGDNRIAIPNDAVMDNNGVMWIGDDVYGVIESPRTFMYEIYLPESPQTVNVEQINFAGDKILIATGGKTEAWSNSFLIDGIFQRDSDGSWSEYSYRFDTVLQRVRDYIRIAVDPRDNDHFFCSTLGAGIIEFQDEEFVQFFDDSNSVLQESNLNPGFVGTTGLTYDSDDNLWVASTQSNNLLSVYTADNEWYTYNFTSTVNYDLGGDVVADDNNQLWLMMPNSGNGVLVFNHNNTLQDTSDDQATLISMNNNLPSNDVFSIAKDLSGQIWIGTDEGVAVIYSPASVFNNGVTAQLPLVERDGYLQYLLSSATVNCITVDGANRKWFGTANSGAYLISEDGTEELLHFTSDNSPLLSNNVKTIGVNPTDGEVLFGTDEGIVAYKGTATEPDAFYNNVYAYPNPVRHDYTGLIAIKGLAQNSHVKITDISGQMVFETYSEGGQAVWDGNLRGGDRAASGVYLVFAADEEGTEREVTKILFVQ